MAADRLVTGNDTLVDVHDAARDVDAATRPHAARGADNCAVSSVTPNAHRVVPGHGDVVEGQRATGHVDAAPGTSGPAVGDRQVRDQDGGIAGLPKDPAEVVAADGQGVGARSVNREAIGDVQLAAGQGDGAGRGEVDRIGPGVGVGGRDCRT